jgi:hypothetical protein
MTEFFRTAMGHRYYESTLPSIARELQRLNDNFERLWKCLEQRASEPAASKEGELDGYEGR